MVIGAALSLGEFLGSTGRDLLKAYVLGIEVLAKMAANCPNVQDRGFHSTPVWGSMGATIACASLLKLDPPKIKAALGIAASAAGGRPRRGLPLGGSCTGSRSSSVLTVTAKTPFDGRTYPSLCPSSSSFGTWPPAKRQAFGWSWKTWNPESAGRSKSPRCLPTRRRPASPHRHETAARHRTRRWARKRCRPWAKL